MSKKLCKCKCSKTKLKDRFPGLSESEKEGFRKKGWTEEQIENRDKIRRDALAYEEMARQIEEGKKRHNRK